MTTVLGGCCANPLIGLNSTKTTISCGCLQKKIAKKLMYDMNYTHGKSYTPEYKTNNATTFKQHRLNSHSSKETREKEFKYYCKSCDYGTISKDILDRHNLSDKHKKKSIVVGVVELAS